MSSHTLHPSTLAVGLVDGCERCEEHASHPLLSLDPDHIAMCWRQMVDVEVRETKSYRSGAEAQACRALFQHYLFLLRFVPDVAAEDWPIRCRSESPAAAS
jgi:hypothetical protein